MVVSTEDFYLQNFIRSYREQRGWSQQQLAECAGLSRTGIGAIESGRLIPSTAAALSLAAAFGCKVEDLFVLPGQKAVEWAWPPTANICRYWRALVGDRQFLYPVEPGPLGMVSHDGIWRDGRCCHHAIAEPAKTLVIACCDPAVGLLASEYARQTSFRMLVVARSSRMALDLLGAGLIHGAGVHLADASRPEDNLKAAAQSLDDGFCLVRVADWVEGLALAPGLASQTVDKLLRSDLHWIGRESGSGARQILDELSDGRIVPQHLARDHRGVAQIIRTGFAQAGVSVRLVCEEEGIDFLSVREEPYDLCFSKTSLGDPRIRTLIEVIRSPAYRKLLSQLPGYDNRRTGDEVSQS